MLLLFRTITFTHDGAAEPVFAGLDAHFPTGWTGIVGANGAGKTTLLRLAAGELTPEHGHVQRLAGLVVSCPQRTDEPPALLGALLAAGEAQACELRGRLGLEADWLERWPTLSHGERKRAQIAVALWQQPDLLLVDEPTNHIDLEARRLLAAALARFQGIGLLVSHDRELLDTLCSQCLFLDPPRATMRPGGYTAGATQAALEIERAQAERHHAKERLAKLKEEARRRQAQAARAASRRSKRRLDPRDHDGKGKIDAAIVSGADGRAGRLATQLGGRLRQAAEALAQIEVHKQYRLGLWLPGSLSPRPLLLTLPAGRLPLGAGRWLQHPELAMGRADRIALTGANGSGKSTLVRHLVAKLALPAERLVYLPQEIDAPTSARVMAAVNALPHDQLGHLMTVVSALGSRPERLLGNTEVSPGEIRKVMLALGVVRLPYLVVMDEPTNHLDLPAIECLEAALAACPCGLLLVSHDLRFLGRLAKTRWHIEALDDTTTALSPAGGWQERAGGR